MSMRSKSYDLGPADVLRLHGLGVTEESPAAAEPRDSSIPASIYGDLRRMVARNTILLEQRAALQEQLAHEQHSSSDWRLRFMLACTVAAALAIAVYFR